MREQVFRIVAPRGPVRYGEGKPAILLVDAGAKGQIVRSLLGRGASYCAPRGTRISRHGRPVGRHPDRNGPGDPKDLAPLIGQVRSLLASYRKPIFGVCLGNQILALAAGGDTYKLRMGTGVSINRCRIS